ncbi:hypothetical protein QYM39_06065 [Pediococcus pentosaceus]|uniref:hypothetical protein n=1 Tax=Pediococcus pentosaceus TaxID=1255 RepID=UPI00265B46B5|nr:hypothetical protein [Pediococcus pentosaceus]WKF70473.1 hypothetical protein QYM39_06065 [Pediococcus pentosaceus]
MKEVIVLNTVQNRKLIDEQLISTLPLLRLKQKQSIIRFNGPLTIGDRWHGTLKGMDRQGNTVEYDCEATVWEC